MKFSTLTYESANGIIRIGINRPNAVNAIDGTMKRELLDAFRQAAQDKEACVVLLFGYGKNFSSGIDLKDMAIEGWEHSPTGWGGHFDQCIAISRAIWDLDIPVVAVVKGYALGAGLDLAIMADFVLAAENARFGAPEIMMGAFAPTLILPWLTNMKKAREILAIGAEMDAEQALQFGLVNRVYPLDTIDEEAEKWARHICNIPRQASQMAKKVINRQYEMMGFWESIAYNREMSVILNLHKTREERQEALKAIREKGLKAILSELDEKTIIR